jgi:hypothetical protein
LAGQGFNVGEAAFEYHPRRPEKSVLYRVVAKNIESFRSIDQLHATPDDDAEYYQ